LRERYPFRHLVTCPRNPPNPPSASLKCVIGSLDRVEAFPRVEGFVLAGPDFDCPSNIINVASHLIIDIFGEEIGRHSRFAIGAAATPLNCLAVIAAKAAIRPEHNARLPGGGAGGVLFGGQRLRSASQVWYLVWCHRNRHRMPGAIIPE